MKLWQAFKSLRYEGFYWLFTRRGVPLVRLGTACQWTVCDTGLNRESRVLSAGAGQDISFERALIERYGCRVVLLDPSPTGIATVEREALPPAQLLFKPLGLAGQPGRIGFQPPASQEAGCVEEAPSPGTATCQLTCTSVSALMQELNWDRIDLLKIDIEGFEYGVFRNILDHALDVRQICVEFHYARGFHHRRGEMLRSLWELRRSGYALIHHIYSDHTLLRREAPKNSAGRRKE